MRRAAVALALMFVVAANAATTNNDDSCDIGVAPAATLLLPYFEVEVEKPPTIARTTIFTIVNTSQYPQIARVTLWSDLAYPVMNFNLFLTGYDVQAVNLYSLLTRNDMNPNHASTPCQRTELPDRFLADVRSILTTGRGRSCSVAGQLGLVHTALRQRADRRLRAPRPRSAKNFGTAIEVRDEVRFDEHETPTTMLPEAYITTFQLHGPCRPPRAPRPPRASTSTLRNRPGSPPSCTPKDAIRWHTTRRC